MIAAYLKLPITQGKVVLQSIENQHGLLVERAQGIYSFSHLTFQEYLTAKEIISKSDNISALKIWLENITEKRWREVFLLLADLLYLLPSADNLLLLMKEKIDGIIAKNVKLQEFITWVHQKSLAVSSSYRPVAVRAFYCTLDYEANLRFDRNFIHSLDTDFARICIQILDLARALNLNPNQACSLSKDCGLALDIALNISLTIAFNLCTGNIQRNRILGITRALNFALLLNSKLHNEIQELKEQIPLMKEDLESFYDWWKFHGQTWTKKLRNLMIKHLNIPHNWFSTNIDNFSFSFWGDESASLNQYYDANKLLVDCLNRAANVTPTVRSHIEDTLLLPIAEIEKRKLAD
jgi:predicted NACHT family NTPase